MVWKDYLYFSRAERNGIKILAALLVIIVSAPHIIDLFRARPAYDFSQTAETAAALEAIVALSRSEQFNAGNAERSTAYTSTAVAITLNPKRFNPNTLSADEWSEMGFPARLGRAVGNYMQAGGSFRFREDLQRIYVMEDSWYEQIEPYIDLPSRGASQTSQNNQIRAARTYSNNKTEQQGTQALQEPNTSADYTRHGDLADLTATAALTYPVHELPLIDINRADTTDLTSIRGIGSVFSRRICSYRDLLGGFYSPGQLLEVYGMDSTRWEQLIVHIDIDSTAIRKINIHQADFSTFLRHPYIDRNLANALTNFMKHHSPLDSLPQIKHLALITDSLYARIAPYLSCE